MQQMIFFFSCCLGYGILLSFPINGMIKEVIIIPLLSPPCELNCSPLVPMAADCLSCSHLNKGLFNSASTCLLFSLPQLVNFHNFYAHIYEMCSTLPGSTESYPVFDYCLPQSTLIIQKSNFWLYFPAPFIIEFSVCSCMFYQNAWFFLVAG